MADPKQQLTLQSTIPRPSPSHPFSSPPSPSPAVAMPLLGFGVYQIHGPAVGPACEAALAAGYRHVDTAQLYCNEAEVGAAVVRVLSGGVPRADVFVTTKIRRSAGSGEATYRRARASVGRVDQRGVDAEGEGEGEEGYVDLFLVHMPWGGRRERRLMWLALERLFEEGQARAIGVSNYEIEHIEDMRGYAKVWPPMVNQILVSGVEDCVHSKVDEPWR